MPPRRRIVLTLLLLWAATDSLPFAEAEALQVLDAVAKKNGPIPFGCKDDRKTAECRRAQDLAGLYKKGSASGYVSRDRQPAGCRPAARAGERLAVRALPADEEEANDNRVQDLNNQFINGRREILSTGPDAYYKLLNYNSQVRLRWAREPLFRYRKFLARRGLRQARSSSESAGSGDRISQRICADPGRSRAALRLARSRTRLGLRHRLRNQGYRPDGKDWRVVMPPLVRSFFKGMLDLFAAQKTGELTSDALESFMTLHGMGGRAFGRPAARERSRRVERSVHRR